VLWTELTASLRHSLFLHSVMLCGWPNAKY
jgi:hypothetical protein